MNNVIKFSLYKKTNRKVLREFYLSLETSNIHLEQDLLARKYFFRKSRGEFIAICRSKVKLNVYGIALKMKMEFYDYLLFEKGIRQISDKQFYQLCNLVGANQEVNIFHEKLEVAFSPVKQHKRIEIAQSLKSRYGIITNVQDAKFLLVD